MVRVLRQCVCVSVGRLPSNSFPSSPVLHIYFHLFRLFIYGSLLSYAISSTLCLPPSCGFRSVRSHSSGTFFYYFITRTTHTLRRVHHKRIGESTQQQHHASISRPSDRKPSLSVYKMGPTVNLNHFECDARKIPPLNVFRKKNDSKCEYSGTSLKRLCWVFLFVFCWVRCCAADAVSSSRISSWCVVAPDEERASSWGQIVKKTEDVGKR